MVCYGAVEVTSSHGYFDLPVRIIIGLLFQTAGTEALEVTCVVITLCWQTEIHAELEWWWFFKFHVFSNILLHFSSLVVHIQSFRIVKTQK